MITVHRIKFKDSYTGDYRKYDDYHKLLYRFSDKSTVIFTKDFIEFKKASLPLDILEIEDEFEGSCIYRVNHVKHERFTNYTVKILIHKDIVKKREEFVKFLNSFRDIYGGLNKISKVTFPNNSSHCLVVVKYTLNK